MIDLQCLIVLTRRATTVSAKTRFNPYRRQLIIGLGRDGVLPVNLLGMLLNEGILADMRVESGWCGRSLIVTLAEHGSLSPVDLLCRLARRLSKLPGHLAVYDPWTIGGMPINMALAVDLIGGTFRTFHATVAV
jgi:hypothetical protein